MKMESESFENILRCGLGQPQNSLGGQTSRINVFLTSKMRLRPWNVMEDVIQAAKIFFLEKLSKFFFIEPSYFSYEAVRRCKECNPKIDCPCINLPYSGSQKSMAIT